MIAKKTLLDDVRVASPCSAFWADMKGDDRVRHCELCRKNVFNLSDMSRKDAEALIVEKEGNLCVRYHQRTDGTILTDNCPVGLRAIRRRMKWMAFGVAAFFALGTSVVLGSKRSSSGGAVGLRNSKPFDSLQNIQPFKAVIDWLDPVRSFPVAGGLKMTVLPTPTPMPTAGTGGNTSSIKTNNQ